MPPVTEIAPAAVMPLPHGKREPAQIAVACPSDWEVTDARLGLYQKCPRRFFYTHVLGLGGGRKPTAFVRSHDCLYELIRWMADARKDREVTVEEAEAAFEELWQERGPVGHAFAADYRRLTSRLVASLVKSGAGRRFRQAQPLALDLPNGRVIVEPDEIAERQNGLVVLRRVRTGHKRTKEYDRLDYTLYQLAGQANFGQNFVVEAAHLTDDLVEEVTDLTAQKIATRRDISNEMLAGIAAGRFPPEVDAVTCPRCPHFFICAATPRGPLTIT